LGPTHVGGYGERVRIAVADHLRVEHRVAQPDVGQQSAVAIAALDVELEADASALEPAPGVCAGAAAERHDRRLPLAAAGPVAIELLGPPPTGRLAARPAYPLPA